MATRLYFHAATSGLSNLPTTEQSSLTSSLNADAQTVNRTMDTNIGTAQTTLSVNTAATASLQTLYFTRFVSDTLSGITSITAQTWTYNFSATQAATAGNFPCAGTAAVRVMAYVWRPGTGKVGNILDGNTAATVVEGGASVQKSHNPSFTGSLVSSVQDGDVICFEVWFQITQDVGISRLDVFQYDGTTVTTTEGTTVSNHASFIETPQTLTFGAAGGPVDCTVTGKSIYNKTTTHA
jgi:hypothetical protein